MSEPLLLLGQGGGNRLFRVNVNPTDDGIAIVARARSVRIAPAGARGEAIFTAVYLAVSYTQDHVITLRPRVDERALDVQTVTLPPVTTPDRQVARFEFRLSEGFLASSGAYEAGRVAPRGTWFELWLEVDPVEGGDLLFEACDLEYEVVREGQPATGVLT